MWIFLIIVIAVIVVIIVVQSKKKAKQKAEAEIKLKEKAEPICSELTKRGYEVTYNDVQSYGGGHYALGVSLNQGGKYLGYLGFRTFGPNSEQGSAEGFNLKMAHAGSGRNMNNTMEHIIHLDKAGIKVGSQVPCSEPPPEWMKICGELLRGYPISFPVWMNDYPEASKYVNVVFQ